MSNVDHPIHYNLPVPSKSRPAIEALLNVSPEEMDEKECIVVMARFGQSAVFWFAVLSAFKYLWRAGLKGTAAEDYDKARWYLIAATQLEKPFVSDLIKHRVKLAIERIPND